MKYYFEQYTRNGGGSGLSLLALVLFSGCGTQETDAHLNDVGTDLAASGRSYSTYMYWLEGYNVVQGRCAPHTPVLRANCDYEKKFRSYRDFEDRLLTPVERQLASARQKVAMWQREFSAIDSVLRANPN